MEVVGSLEIDHSRYPMAQEIASAGFVAATIEYRLSPEAQYPAAIYDLKSAVRWLRANCEKY